MSPVELTVMVAAGLAAKIWLAPETRTPIPLGLLPPLMEIVSVVAR